MTNHKTDVNEKIEYFESLGWRYVADGRDWSSGIWVHDQLGTVNNGGDSFRWIGQAIEAIQSFIENLEKCQ